MTGPSDGSISRAASLPAMALADTGSRVVVEEPRGPTVLDDFRMLVEAAEQAMKSGVCASAVFVGVAASAIVLSAEAIEKEAKARQ